MSRAIAEKYSCFCACFKCSRRWGQVSKWTKTISFISLIYNGSNNFPNSSPLFLVSLLMMKHRRKMYMQLCFNSKRRNQNQSIIPRTNNKSSSNVANNYPSLTQLEFSHIIWRSLFKSAYNSKKRSAGGGAKRDAVKEGGNRMLPNVLGKFVVGVGFAFLCVNRATVSEEWKVNFWKKQQHQQ